MNKKSLLLLALSVAILFVSGYEIAFSTHEEIVPQKSGIGIARPIPTVTVRKFVNRRNLVFPGIVQAKARVDMAFNIDGQIVEANLIEGTKVSKGAVLARLGQQDFQYSFDAALASSERIKKEFERIRNLRDKQVISESEFEMAKSNHDIAQAELKIRKKALDDTLLLAPFDGMVAMRYVENFQHIKAREAVLSFQDISTIEVAIQVPERIVARTMKDVLSQIDIQFDVDGTRWYHGEIKEYSLQSDPITRTYKIIISTSCPAEFKILPGMAATVRTDVAMFPENLQPEDKTGFQTRVPLEAVFQEGTSQSYCWVIPSEGGNPEKRKVEVGAMHNQGILITSGLRLGEQVAIAGLHSMHSTQNIRPAKLQWEGLDG